jgi:subtilisin family serine protease
MRRRLAAAATVVAGLAVAAPATAAETAPVVEDQYIVTLKPGTKNVADVAHDVTGKHDGQLKKTFRHALKGFVVTVPENQLADLESDPNVQSVEPDRIVSVADTQSPATWGLDRIDQRELPLDNSYMDGSEGAGVHAYIIDTGILQTHAEFVGRMSNGFDAVTASGNASDCNGHGTHVAGTVGGATYGVADKVTLHPVRVLGCTGSGTTSGVIAGIDWVTANAVKPAVANMSLGGGISTALDNAVTNSIASGVTYAVAAGNESTYACNRSPARTPNAITVGATTSADARASFSNFGTCVDVFAPGNGITSAWIGNNSATNTISGTSMATPHAAGAAALILSETPAATPATVASALVNNATPNKITDAGTGSPNRLLFVGAGAAPGPTCNPVTNGTDVAITDLATVNSPITVSGCQGNASAAAQVEVHIVHTYIGDLVVSLVAPDGSSYVLHNRAGGSADNINQTYSVNLSSEQANGTWTLRVRDAAAADTGRIDSWTIRP